MGKHVKPATEDELALADQLAKLASEFTAAEDEFWSLDDEPEPEAAQPSSAAKRPVIPARLKRANVENSRRSRVRGRRRR